MAELRTKLLLSYSRADSRWRDDFRRHLSTIFVSDDLWIDCTSIPEGADWNAEIEKAVSRTRCALVLLTPSYLDMNHYSRRELDLLLSQVPALKVLPVLVEDCAWQGLDGLSEIQFVDWPGSTRRIEIDGGARETLRPLVEAPHREHAIIEICQRTQQALGVVGQARPDQIDDLFAETQAVLGTSVVLEEAVHSGTFSVLYRGSMHGSSVAVKAVPDTPRLNTIRALVADAAPKLALLSDPAFIRLRDSNVESEPHYFVMDFVEWPTLDDRLATGPERVVPPSIVAKLLAQVARAQRDATRVGFQVGPLTVGNLHVSDDWQVRFSPLRIEGLLARASNMAIGQLLNWDALTNLAPEISAGCTVTDPTLLSALDQYYLGLLGLEMLLGRPPCEVRCFDDLMLKSRFFQDPRSFFEGELCGETSWVDECPSLAYLLVRFLARSPLRRLRSSDDVVRDLEEVIQGDLPTCVRAQLDADVETIAKPEFTHPFYDRLLELRPMLRSRLGDRAKHARMLADSLPDLLAFDPLMPRRSRLQRIADTHAGYGLCRDDVEAFRKAFLHQVRIAFDGAPEHMEAWRAALARGLAAFGARR
jgi:hypothetical protein